MNARLNYIEIAVIDFERHLKFFTNGKIRIITDLAQWLLKNLNISSRDAVTIIRFKNILCLNDIQILVSFKYFKLRWPKKTVCQTHSQNLIEKIDSSSRIQTVT
ncbi:hypothetical protein BpHYR1_045918 [Brachionus plicatilis]|uniref:Uncharacterized protein n=1 Tax=Brachionus plicatilis TaxID=10195 RepID=A0A3M7PJT1_BRAPC|nr:hypothetical protein BpHYR1_045918 [Brachionus plicatilis]